jgi:hypothetical protein
MCELCEDEPALRWIELWEKDGSPVELHLGATCIRKILGD